VSYKGRGWNREHNERVLSGHDAMGVMTSAAAPAAPPPEFAAANIWPLEWRTQTQVSYAFGGQPVVIERWAYINYFVGPNGSGKTTVFNSIMQLARNKWPGKVKVLGTGRLGPLEKSITRWWNSLSSIFQEDRIDQVYNLLNDVSNETAHEAFLILEKRLDLRLRVTSFLKHVFGREIHLEPTRQGLQVYASFEGGQGRYSLLDECHGLKELITLLTFLYDDTFRVLGIDEPELHLHPQFQRYLMAEIRKYAGNPAEPGKKLIFLVSHSPIILDLRTLRDIGAVVVFPGRHSAPRRIDLSSLSPEEQIKMKRALPTFQTLQREMLFCETPIFVEGPGDLAVMEAVVSRLDLPLGAAGIGLASMGGKGQLFAYRALTKGLAKDRARFILDLDAGFDANCLKAIQDDPRVVAALASAGAGGNTLTQEVGELRQLVHAAMERASAHSATIADLQQPPLTDTAQWHTASAEASFLRVLRGLSPPDRSALSVRDDLPIIEGKLSRVRDAALAAGVLILRKGSIEAYYNSVPGLRLSDFAKQGALENELISVASEAPASIESRYEEPLNFLKSAASLEVPLAKGVAAHVADLVNALQVGIRQGNFRTPQDVERATVLELRGFWHIAKLEAFEVESPSRFRGRVRVKAELGGEVFEFTEQTRAFELIPAE